MADKVETAATQPLFTIVTVVFNGARSIADTILSVDRQSLRNFEYIVLDGGSTDGTVAILEEHSKRITHWASAPDSGIYHAWNNALALARGEWVAFLGADDVYYPDALAHYARTIAAFDSNESDARLHPQQRIEYVSSRVELASNGAVVRTIGAPWSWPAFAHHMTVAHVGSMHRRTLFAAYGRFDESYRICADYEFLLRPRAKLRAAFVEAVTVRMALGGISTANAQLALAEQERAKRTTGGRTAWRCRMERRMAYVRHRGRSLLWY